MSSKKVVRSAVCMIPPESVWPQIQAIRSKHDKAFDRWMPHVNLLYPFYEDTTFAEHHRELTKKFESRSGEFESFRVRMNHFGFFKHGKSSFTVFLEIDTSPQQDAMSKLQLALEGIFPECDDLRKLGKGEGFKAHLTVGQWNSESAVKKAIAEFEKTWKPIEFDLAAISMISRSSSDQSDPFHVRYTVPLSGSRAVPAPTSVFSAPLVSDRLEVKVQRPAAKLTAVVSLATRAPAPPVAVVTAVPISAVPVKIPERHVPISAGSSRNWNVSKNAESKQSHTQQSQPGKPRSALVTPVSATGIVTPCVDVEPIAMFHRLTRVTPLTSFSPSPRFLISPVSFVTPSVSTNSRERRA